MEKRPRPEAATTTFPPQDQDPAEGIPVISPRAQTPPAPQNEYWSTGLFDCFSDVTSCCLVLWCPCIAFGQLSEIIDKGTSSCCCNGSLYLLLCLLGGVGRGFVLPIGCQCIYSCTYRSKLKHTFDIPARSSEDCCVHCWCESCALCQEYRELQIRGYHVSLGWNGNKEKIGQQSETVTPPITAIPAPVPPRMAR